MAVLHLSFNRSLAHGSMLGNALNQFENGYDRLNEQLSAMALMIDGDGSSPTHFPYFTQKYGFEDDVHSQAAWNELNSLMAKLNTDASVTSVKSALEQAFAKFR